MNIFKESLLILMLYICLFICTSSKDMVKTTHWLSNNCEFVYNIIYTIIYNELRLEMPQQLIVPYMVTFITYVTKTPYKKTKICVLGFPSPILDSARKKLLLFFIAILPKYFEPII